MTKRVSRQEITKSDIVKNEEFIGEHLETLREFAERGDASVMYLLGCYYDGGVCEGGGNDPDEAVKWYKKVSRLGNTHAMNNLGVMYLCGQGVRKSAAKASKWFRKAAELGSVVAQKNLAEMYRYGDGVRVDSAEAAKWYEKAAAQGYAGAQYDLGELYASGNGVAKDLHAAEMWYRKAAEQGNAEARRKLAST